MNKDTLIKVLNRDNGATIYSIPEMNGLRRVFQAGETKEITFEELQKLSYIPGGMALLRENLVILDNDEAVNLILNHVEPEYSYTKDDIINLLKNGTLDELLDCLDFAPEGVKELIKAAAVELPLNDVAKR
jgi:division protein CdvB (Snf7/Vps24/ESCRT-III family)